jgi:hypothetical protein
VQRQYTGTAGRVENSQVAVFLVYASPGGRALVDRRIYLPEHTWCADTDRRVAAGIPAQTALTTKPGLALDMIDAALDAGLPASWVTADEVYGSDPQLRAGLRARGVGYVLAIGCNRRVALTAAPGCAWTPSPPPCRPPPGSDTRPEPARKDHATTTGPGSSSTANPTGGSPRYPARPLAGTAMTSRRRSTGHRRGSRRGAAPPVPTSAQATPPTTAATTTTAPISANRR